MFWVLRFRQSGFRVQGFRGVQGMGPYRVSGMMVEFLCYSRVGLVRSKVSLYFRMVLTYTYIFYTLF